MCERKLFILLMFALASSVSGVQPDERPAVRSLERKHAGPGCSAVDNEFITEVWTKVAERT